MARQKSPISEKELEELLKAIESDGEEVDLTEYDNNVILFLSHFDIKPGNELIRNTTLYKLYCSWCSNPASFHLFTSNIMNFIPGETHGSRNYYKTNISPKSLIKQTLKSLDNNKRDKIKNKSWKLHFDNFIKKHEIKSGDSWIEAYILYFLYDKWIYENKQKNGLGYIQFVRFLKLYGFEYRFARPTVLVFKIDPDIIKHLSVETLKNLRMAHAKEKQKHTKK